MISIRVRLTFWYFICLAAILAVFAIGARVALRASLHEAIDHDLRARLGDVRDFIREESRAGEQNLRDELREDATMGLGGGNAEVWDASGTLLFRSARLGAGQLGGAPSGAARPEVRYSQAGAGRAAYRVASFGIDVNGKRYLVRAAEPMREFSEGMQQFDWFLAVGTPLLLLLACGGGFVLSQRALAPVDRLTRDAHLVSIASLATRLAVPAANDELRRLAVTLNAMLERIEGSVQRMVQFTGDASHELRTPLTLIHSAAEFSLRGARSREELEEGLRRILRESERTARLLDDLLLLARTDEGVLRATDLGEAVTSAVARIRPMAEAKGIALEAEVPAGVTQVQGDQEALVRLFVILLDNAVKYTEPGGRARVRLEVAGGAVLVMVTDNGPGIAPEDLPRIWDRFWRADKVRSRSVGGAGLGLAIARAIADRHGAVLTAESIVGEGSRFVVRF